MAKLVSRAEQKLMDSGASIAPPERIRSSAVVMPAPVISTRSTRQRRSDVLAMSSMSDNVADIPEEIEEFEGSELESGEESDKESGEDEESDEESDEKKKSGEDKKSDEDEKDCEEEKDGKSDDDGFPAISASMASQKPAGVVVSASMASQEPAGVVSASMASLGPAIVSASMASPDSAVVGTLQRGRSITPKPVHIAGGDISMQSPSNSPPKLHGASRISGGILRGQAVGNSSNAADFSNPDNNDYIGPIQGRINIYVSQDDPAQLSPDTLTTYSRLLYDYASKTPIAPVLEKIARRYSPVRRKLFGFGFGFVLNLFIRS